jgi:hypothetical protein
MGKKPVHKHKPSADFDLETLHNEAIARNSQARQDRISDPRKHLSKTYEHNVKGTYEASMKYAQTEQEKAHIESVLNAGPGRYKK